MEKLYVYYNTDFNQPSPIEESGFYATGYHLNPVKIGDLFEIVFTEWDGDSGKGNSPGPRYYSQIVKMVDIRQQWWNGDNDPKTNPSLHKYTLIETDPAFKNWVKFQPLDEVREEKINQILL